VLNFVGRWGDAEDAKDYQQNFRTARPKLARVVPGKNRLYTILGSALAAYNVDTFISRLSVRPLILTPGTSAPVSGSRNDGGIFGPPEVFLMWDAFFYAENGGGWITPIEDGLERLFDFDWDDRGNIYLAYSVFGWGIVKDNGDTGGGLFRSLSQTVRTTLTPDRIVSLKTSDGKYYAALSDLNQTGFMQISDVSDPTAPVALPDVSGRSFSRWAKDSTSSRVAIIDPSGVLSIFTSDAFVHTGAPVISLNSTYGFSMVTSDGTNFYAYGNSATGTFFDIISLSGNTYVEKRIPCQAYAVAVDMHYGDGYLAVTGAEVTLGVWNIRLYKVGPGTLTEIPFDMPVPGSNGAHMPFWPMYYASPPTGYTAPYYNNFKDACPIKIGSKVYLVLSAYGLGDVWEVKAGDALTARMSAAAETPNPNSAAGGGAGPFYGDRQTFTSTLASGSTANVSWDFGDSTNGSSVTGGGVKHQYGGVASLSSLPLVRRVTASDVSDPTINDSVSVTLAAPQPGFRIANTAYLFRQPDASSSASIVAGDSFLDISDGAVEGHYTDWVLDSASNKKLPSEAFSVGSCGGHSLVFNTHYGPYSGTGSALASSSSDLLLSISPFNYTVRPYIITVQDPDPALVSNPNAVFNAAVRLADTTDLPAGGGTAVTYKWEVIDASNATVASANGSATLGAIPAFSVPRDTFIPLGRRVRLTTTVAPSAVPGAGCAGLVNAVAASSVLNGPDPAIVKTGCVTVGSPCSFTVTSATNPTLSGWSFAWSVNPTVTGTGGAGSVFMPQFTTTTDYSVTVVATNGIASKTATLSGQHIDKPLCSSAPDQVNFFFGTGSSTNPAPGDTVSFVIFPRGWTPTAECDKFAWTFGDGGTSTDFTPTHVYTNPGTYTVTLTLTGALATATYSITVTVGTTTPPPGNGGGPGPGSNGSCPTPLASSAYVAYTAALSGCTAVSGACNPGELVQFVIRSDTGYNLSCGNTTVSWAFGDGAFDTGLSPAHAYSNAGIYHATATLSNTAGTMTYAQDVRVGNVQPKACDTLTQQNVSIGWAGPGCTETSGACKASDLIAFRTGGSYDFSCTATHTYSWDFGDGLGHSTLPQPSYSYGSGTYTVKLTVGNGTSSTTITRSITIAASGSPGTGGGCGTMVPDNNVYVYFTGDGCTAVAGNCSAKSDVAFGVGATGYDFGCALHTYTWDFGDGSQHSTNMAPSHRYTVDGTYHVTVHLSNGSAAVDLTTTVKVVNGAVAGPPRGGRAVRH
jgi:PKD repeat protein